MRGWLLDTDVISELRKPDRNSQVKIWIELQPEETLFLSIVSIAEIRFGVRRTANEALRRRLEHWLATDVRQWFAGRIVEIDEDAMLEWIEMVERGRAAGHTFPQPDLLIAASARLHDLCVVTGNVAHFTPAQVAVFDPWHNMLHMPGRKAVKVSGAMTIDRVR